MKEKKKGMTRIEEESRTKEDEEGRTKRQDEREGKKKKAGSGSEKYFAHLCDRQHQQNNRLAYGHKRDNVNNTHTHVGQHALHLLNDKRQVQTPFSLFWVTK